MSETLSSDSCQEFEIFCIGDSLTEGHTGDANDGTFSPYSTFLSRLVCEKHNCAVTSSGQSGEFTVAMKKRLDMILSSVENDESAKKFDLVCILAGTNDLGCSETPKKIFKNLLSMYNRVLSHGAELCVITVPENGLDLYWLDSSRKELNDKIRKYVRRESEKDFIVLFDLEKEIPHSQANKKYWSEDDLHMSKRGYKHFAKKLYKVLTENQILERETETQKPILNKN